VILGLFEVWRRNAHEIQAGTEKAANLMIVEETARLEGAESVMELENRADNSDEGDDDEDGEESEAQRKGEDEANGGEESEAEAAPVDQSHTIPSGRYRKEETLVLRRGWSSFGF
jgi:hypothetical protein